MKRSNIASPGKIIIMLKSYFKIGWRNLWKNKFSTTINLVGLSIGLVSCLLIALYVQHEASFDNFQPNRKRIARAIMEYGMDGSPETKRGNFTSTKVAPVFARTFPEIETAIRMMDATAIVYHEGNALSESNFLYADSTFTKIFANDFLQGNPKVALNGPRKVILSETTAKRYFRNESPLNKILLVGSDSTAYEITGVVKDYPTNSQIKFDFIASFSSLGANQEETYFNANYTTYFLLKGEKSIAPLQEKITPFMKKEMAGSGASINYILEPFDQIHLHSEYSAFVPNTNISYLYTLSAVGLLILVIVCFTYINLSTARSLERAKEVGIRKVSGAQRAQLYAQFVGESFLVFTISVVIGISIITVSLPFFNHLTEQNLSMENLLSPTFIFVSIAITVGVSLLAGSYPAVLLSKFLPAKVLKGTFKNSSAGKFVQHALTVFQFAISTLLIVSTLVMQRQLHFIQHKNLGFDRNHIVALPMNERILDKLALIKHELKTNPNVTHVSRCVSSPVSIVGGYTMRSSTMAETEQITVNATPIDEDYIKTTGLQLIAGSDLSEQDIKDVSHEDYKKHIYHFILNESAAHELGWSAQDAVGKDFFMGERTGTVRGVVRDFHFQSLHEPIRPVVLFPELRTHGKLLVKISSDNVPSTLSFIQTVLDRVVPGVPFEYHFLDDDFDNLYKSESKLGVVMNLFSGIAIVLACLGLLGLSGYRVQQRIKEIGIRKILGATYLNIVSILSTSFLKPILFSIVIACPVAYWFMNQWLQKFTYHIDTSWWIFAATALLVIITALITIAAQALKAAVANPVDSLRAE